MVALPTFPTDALPSWLRAWVEAQAEALQVPSDLPGLLSLSILATAGAQRFCVQVRPGWIEPVNLYALIALPSGTRKSVLFNAATEPLLDFEQEGPQLFVSDATPERVASLLAENGGRMAVLSDEGEICSVIAGRYGGNFEVFLKAHSGTVLTIERQGRARVHVRKPALTLGLAVQPDVLRALLAKRSVNERGLLARFLIAVPSSNLGYRTIAPEPVPEDIEQTYAANIRALLDLPDRGEVCLSKKAHEIFTAFEAEVEEMLRPDALLGGITSWGSKLCGAVARIAGLLWCARSLGNEGEIDPATVRAAISIGRYLIPHTLTAFDSNANPADPSVRERGFRMIASRDMCRTEE